MGYITSAQNLGDFYADSTIGQKQFEINKNTGAFAAQAFMRASSGIEFNAERLKQLAATAGYTNAANVEDVAAGASKAFETLGQNLLPTAKLSGIYEQGATMTNEQAMANQKSIQTELENELFVGTASERRKRLLAQEVGSFQAQPGTVTRNTGASVSLGGTGTSNLI